MIRKTSPPERRAGSLSRDQIVAASIDLLDANGEGGLTFRALSERLATGPGAIYWHVDNKQDLLVAACDAMVARTLDARPAGRAAPANALRTLALDLFDLIDAHPWVGAALARAPGQLPIVRIVERIGGHVLAMDVPTRRQWATVSALLNYILGVGGQNAANGQFARAQGIERDGMLDGVARTWAALDAAAYPFVRSMADPLRTHDDRADFLAGVDLILKGIEAQGAARR